MNKFYKKVTQETEMNIVKSESEMTHALYQRMDEYTVISTS